jgi:hypothetical protein
VKAGIVLALALLSATPLAAEPKDINPFASTPLFYELKGEAVQGGLLIGHAAPHSTVMLDGKPVLVTPEGAFVIGFGRDHGLTAQLEVSVNRGPRERRTLIVLPRVFKIQRIEGVAEKYVEPSPADMKRIEEERRLIREARARGIPIIIATQMLESMIGAPAPTRAEASDVAGAVYEGADALMLSAESAVGDYPLEAVAIMDRIITRVEHDPRWPELMRAEYPVEDADADALVAAARRAAEAASTACLVAFTTTGQTALRLSRERPLQPTLALTPNLSTARRLALAWGVEPRVVPELFDPEDLARVAIEQAVESDLCPPGQRLLILAGLPMGSPGAANILRLAHTPLRR